MTQKTDLVVAGFVFHSSKLLLIKHKKLGVFLPPGGHIEENETPDNALIREIKEELGLDIVILNTQNLLVVGKMVKNLANPFYVNVHNVGDHNHCCLFYLCTVLENEKIKHNEKELDGFCWLDENEIENNKQVPEDVKNITKLAFESYKKIQYTK